MLSTNCLTTIDPSLMPNHKIFVTTDASDIGSGAVLTFGPTYDTAQPVAYDSCAFKGAELNYPVHKKELLAIICTVAVLLRTMTEQDKGKGELSRRVTISTGQR